MGILILSQIAEAAALEGTIDLELTLEGRIRGAVGLDPGPIDLQLEVLGELDGSVRLESFPIDLQFEVIGELQSNVMPKGSIDLGLSVSGDLHVVKEFPTGRIYPYNRWSDTSIGNIEDSGHPEDFPAENTQRQERSEVWRSNDLVNPYMIRWFDGHYKFNSFALVGTNATRNGRFRVRFADYPDWSPTSTHIKYDSGWTNVWGPFLGIDEAALFGHLSTRYPSDEVLNILRFCHETIRTVRILNFGMIHDAVFCRVDFYDPENPDGFFEVAWVHAGIAITITDQLAYDFQWEMVHENKIDRSYSGRLWTDIYYRQMVVTAKIVAFPRDRYMATWQNIVDWLGDTKEFLIQFRDDSFAEEFWMSSYVRFREIPSFVWGEGETFEETIVFEELP